ncbi:hypothetical protein [Nocardia aurantia]|uniref:hypothetical protein n=1 Tax=Nocardia aurantia TaxID=2585199 RepID=UPI0012969484|nr:hypothetical protein [Nocardia aurantia]
MSAPPAAASRPPTRPGHGADHEYRTRNLVLGAGYVGLTTATCLAALGNTVMCVDSDVALIAQLRTGHSHLAEPGVETLS